jgi:hypothetical protein
MAAAILWVGVDAALRWSSKHSELAKKCPSSRHASVKWVEQ